jgi:hypothetical protein
LTDKLTELQKLERAARGRYQQNAGRNDNAEIVEDIARILRGLGVATAQNINPLSEPSFRPGYVLCDCICNCGSVVQVVRQPRKGTNDTLCMACLERHNRKEAEHMPWPVSGVVVLPPEKPKP